MSSLDSDVNTPLRFYNRVMYSGFKCRDQGLGSMLVEEKNTLVAGCHPYELNNVDLRAVNVSIPTDLHTKMHKIMDEATPPIVSEDVLLELSHSWIKCPPLVDLNVEEDNYRKKGTTYMTTCAMETPGSPDYIPIIYEAKSRLINLMNGINMTRPDSDGIFARVFPMGTGVHIILHVPQVNIEKLTVVDSLLSAMEKIQWPGRPSNPKFTSS